MSKVRFTKEQIEELLKNKNIEKCSEKSITYNKDFKIKEVNQYNEGLKTRTIFENAGFNINFLGIKKLKDTLLSWIKVSKNKGIEELSKETRGKGRIGKGPQNIKGSDKEKMELLELKIAYLEEENRFLKILRKQKGLD